MEQLNSHRQLVDVFNDVRAIAPDVAGTLRASNTDEQKEAFLAGQIDEPQHTYEGLRTIDYAAVDEELAALGRELERHPDVEEMRASNALLQAAALYNGSTLQAEKDAAALAYKTLNESLYGTVDMAAYQAMISESIRGIAIDPEDEYAGRLLGELKGMFPAETLQCEEETYRPSDETFQAVREAAELLYEGLGRHVPDRDTPYTSVEIHGILEEIVREEFGESAADWQVIRRKQNGLSVEALCKEVRVSETISKDAAGLRGLIAHELGVHMLRAVRGGETDLLPMELGFAKYAAAEEGLAMVLQQAITGKYHLAGAGHYITAGFMTAGHGFRDTFEMKWRLAVLQNYDAEKGITPAIEEKAKKKAYADIRRFTRGTDDLLFLKDLSYYNGTKAMWEFFERHAGDDFMLNLALLGKLDPTQPEHMRAALESRSTQSSLEVAA
jgi:hypothetical protein